jgi:pyruvate dehydrogenase E1 component beta subunit
VPFSNTLEDLYVPDAQRIANAVKAVAEWTR